MSLIDIIREFRTRKPDADKAARALKVIGWFCFLTGAWNYTVTQLMPFERGPFKLSPNFPVLALVFFSSLGALFLLSARGILSKEPWGKRLAQASVVILVAAIPALVAEVFSWSDFPFSSIPVPFFVIFPILFIGQVVVPAWLGINYLGRLPGGVKSKKQDGITCEMRVAE